VIRFAHEQSLPLAQFAIQLVIAKISNTFIDFIRSPRLFRFRPERIALRTCRATQVWDAVVTADGQRRPLARFSCTQLILWPRP